MHGADRISAVDPLALPADDAHHAETPDERKLRRELHAALDPLEVNQPALWDLEGHEI